MKTNKLLISMNFGNPVELYSDTEWEMWEVQSRDVLATSHRFVAIRSRCTWERLPEVRKSIEGEISPRSMADLNVIVHPSSTISGNLKRVRDILNCKHVDSTKGYLTNAASIKLQLTARPPQQPPEVYFIEPYLEVPGNKDQNALQFISRWVSTPAYSGIKERVLALIAPAGVGKTTLARQIAYHLRSKKPVRQIPLLVESSVWAGLAEGHQASLWDIWKRAVDVQYRSVITEEDFEAFVEEGCIVPIFDGFDELCSRRGESFVPAETLSTLRSLVEAADGKLIITTRDGFWEDNLSAEDREGIGELHLQPFVRQQVAKYIEKRFPTPPTYPKREMARNIIQRLQSEVNPTTGRKMPDYRQRLWSLPIVVYLICESADAVEKGQDSRFGQLLDEQPIFGVLTMLCSRERARRKLQLTADEQLTLLQMLACELPERFSAKNMDLYATTYWESLDEMQVEILHSHALLLPIEEGLYRFRFEFLRDFLRAKAVVDTLKLDDMTPGVGGLINLLAEESAGQGAVVDHLSRELGDSADEVVRLLAKGWREIQRAQRPMNELLANKAQSALVHCLISAMNMVEPGMDKRTRRDALEAVAGQGFSDGLYVEGVLNGIDLRDVSFQKCHFNHSGFRGCRFNKSSEFLNCRFVGTFIVDSCDGFSSVVEKQSELSREAREVFLTFTGSTVVTRDHVIDVMADQLGRFYRSGSFQSLKTENAVTAKLRHSPLAKMQRKLLLRCGVMSYHQISGLGRKSGLAIEKDAMTEVRYFLDNRVLGARLAPVVKEVFAQFSK